MPPDALPVRGGLPGARTGLPVMRPMLLEFPADPACDTLDRQYMLGDSLLVAPVFTHDDTVSYYLPAGKWTNILDGRWCGARLAERDAAFLSLPLLARPNSVIPLGANAPAPHQ